MNETSFTTNSPELAQLVEFGEAEACADMLLAAAASLGTRVVHIGSAIALVASQIPIMLFNRVVGLGLREPATEAMLDDVVAMYREAGVTRYAVQISPAARPAELPDWLEARGLLARDNWAKVYRTATPPPEISTDLRIESIGSEHAQTFAQVTCTAFGMPLALSAMLVATNDRPGWRQYLAFDGDEAVATGALYVRGDVGWLGVGSTLPSHRRRGGQGALMARRIQDGVALGCKWLVTETGEDLPERPNPSYHNMVRTGFALAYQRINYFPSH
jgi:hypothetical protein